MTGGEYIIDLEKSTNKNIQITRTNIKYGGLEISKTDRYSNLPLAGVGYQLYKYNNNGWECVYTLADTDSQGKTSSLSNLGRNSNITLKNEYGVEVYTKYTIEPGKYSLYEYKNPNPGYNIEFQGQRFDEGRGAFIGTVEIKADEICNVNNISYTYSDPNTGKDESIKYTQNEQFASIYINKYIEAPKNKNEDIINNKNDIVRDPLEGATFKLYQNNKVVKLRNVNNKQYTEEFTSKLTDDGQIAKVSIERIPIGKDEQTYELYETGFPKDVDPCIQPGYDASTKKVKIATIIIKADGNVDIQMVEDSAFVGKTGKPYRKAEKALKAKRKDGDNETKVYIDLTNRKYIQVSGYVWEDIGPDTKTPGNGNNRYEEENDKKISGMTVCLHQNGKNGALESLKTNDGEYKFTTLIPSVNLKNGDYFVKFKYSEYGVKSIKDYEDRKGYLYIPVEYSFNEKNGSKAITREMLEEDDNALFQDKEACTGYGDMETKYNAITSIYNQIERNLLELSDWIQYDTGDSIPTLHYMNLGIRQLVHPEFTIEQTIDHAILTVNGYKYTYIYENDGDEKNFGEGDILEPTVRWQSETDKSSYCLREIYPSDIPKNGVNTELQIVYKIDITNNTDTNIEALYKEDKMFVTSLFNNYDFNRYTLVDGYNWSYDSRVTEENIEENKKRVIAKAIYNVEADSSPLKDGIKANEKETVYIAFYVNDGALRSLFNYPNGIVEDYPTKATASVYHEYTRYDYSWLKPKVTQGEVHSSWHTWDNQKGRRHKSVTDTRSDTAPYLALILHKKDRTISGIIFEDNKVDKFKIDGKERDSSKEAIGNGEYDSDENKIERVKIDLLESDKKTYARLYSIEDKEYYTSEVLNDPSKKVKEIYSEIDENNISEIRYEIKGVIPGEYYIRFTYGDGSQKIVDLNGNEVGEIYSNGYKSTIVSNQGTQLAYHNKGPDNNLISSQKDYIWYLDIKNKECNTAVDNEINSNDSNGDGIPDCFEYDYQVDFRVENNDTSVKKIKSAYTPLISVPIEFIASKEGGAKKAYSSYDNMSFGIIKKPKVTMKLKKEITNIKLTYNNGQELFNGNPSSNIPYVSNFDKPVTDSGSRNVKVEANNSNIYGATLEVIYTITVENESDLTYITEDYYKYGTVPMQNNKIDESKEAKIYVNSLLEYLDPLLKIKLASNINNNNGEEYTYNDNKKIEIPNNSEYGKARDTLAGGSDNKEIEAIRAKYKEVYELGNMDDKQYMIKNGSPLRTTKVSNEESETSTKLQVVATRILSNENDELDYISYAQLSTVTTAKNAYSDPTAVPLVEVEGGDYWNTGTIPPPYKKIPGDSTDITITPATGLNKNMDYYIAGIIVLIALGAVVVCVKKIIK